MAEAYYHIQRVNFISDAGVFDSENRARLAEEGRTLFPDPRFTEEGKADGDHVIVGPHRPWLTLVMRTIRAREMPVGRHARIDDELADYLNEVAQGTNALTKVYIEPDEAVPGVTEHPRFSKNSRPLTWEVHGPSTVDVAHTHVPLLRRHVDLSNVVSGANHQPLYLDPELEIKLLD